MPSQIDPANVVPRGQPDGTVGVFRHMKILDYQIRVTGRVPADVLEEIEAVQVTVQPMRTILRGSVPDQAALNQMINRLQGLGLELTETRRLSP